MPIEVIPEPSLSETVCVGQKAFGYLDPTMQQGFLETIALDSCVGLYVGEKKNGFQGLAHTDPSLTGNGYQARQFLNYLKASSLSTGHYDRIAILSSGKESASDGIDDISAVLKIKGYRDFEVMCDPLLRYPIFDRDGNLRSIDPKTIHKIPGGVELSINTILTLNPAYGLLCENTGKRIGEQRDDVYEGVGRFAHLLNEHGGFYEVRIPVADSFNPRALEVAQQAKEPKGVNVQLCGVPGKKYISISVGGYRPHEDHDVVHQVNKFASDLASDF